MSIWWIIPPPKSAMTWQSSSLATTPTMTTNLMRNRDSLHQKKGFWPNMTKKSTEKRPKKMVLGEYGVVGRDEDAERRQKVLAELKKSAQSVQDIAVSARADAYTTEEMVAFKKPSKKKKKKTKSRRMRADDLLDNQDLSIPEGGDVNDEAAPRKWGMKAADLDAGEDDDDELRLALERTRRQKSRANTETSLESISAALAQRRKDESLRTDYAENSGNGLTISANVESIRSLGAVPTAQRKVKTEPTTENAQRTIKEEPVATDMMDVDAAIDEPTEKKKSAWTGVGQTIKEEPPAHVRIPEAEIKQEPESDTEEFTLLEETKLARGGRDRRGGGTFEELRDYNPDSKLEYYDESGHTIDVKEAFRQLSYKFHGIKPGKAKIEKMMKKRAEQLSLNKMSNTDTPLDTVDKLRRKNEATGSAYVVLSGQQNLDLKKMGKKREADRESKTGPSGAATKKAKK
ncbi:hypothetical protein SARC_09975 [Sphaeroforma arctica JP610]|uniref:SART-1 protein n=1 Tax=Sphaeroforma arctica JP610 TaxID=667725 RepID=A0A0L0FNL8_9EUKA|nr:hypothetical protein SARC_09975 [Sphaeroforma arctica JP610]KNC77563.1 hypothetical protein SARC_09975 [Sphaeroforma arctica JP610]|eukprot:XP_014151465.1 hypothetical protein SARC_09975 [Sphaeroforma arctica JP610]